MTGQKSYLALDVLFYLPKKVPKKGPAINNSMIADGSLIKLCITVVKSNTSLFGKKAYRSATKIKHHKKCRQLVLAAFVNVV